MERDQHTCETSDQPANLGVSRGGITNTIKGSRMEVMALAFLFILSCTDGGCDIENTLTPSPSTPSPSTPNPSTPNPSTPNPSTPFIVPKEEWGSMRWGAYPSHNADDF